jgi:hypothetical protein
VLPLGWCFKESKPHLMALCYYLKSSSKKLGIPLHIHEYLCSRHYMWFSPYIIEVGWWKEKLGFMSGMGKCFSIF